MSERTHRPPLINRNQTDTNIVIGLKKAGRSVDHYLVGIRWDRSASADEFSAISDFTETLSSLDRVIRSVDGPRRQRTRRRGTDPKPTDAARPETTLTEIVPSPIPADMNMELDIRVEPETPDAA